MEQDQEIAICRGGFRQSFRWQSLSNLHYRLERSLHKNSVCAVRWNERDLAPNSIEPDGNLTFGTSSVGSHCRKLDSLIDSSFIRQPRWLPVSSVFTCCNLVN